MRSLACIGLCAAKMAASALAVPPGPIDGVDIPSNFGAGALLATQTNRTGFGNQTAILGGNTPGSEANALYVANDDSNLYIGITGNLQTNGNAFIILIDADNSGATGMNELMTQGVDGPPFTLQNMGQPTTDCMTFGTGTLLPTGFGADYAVAVDTFGGTMFVSEYNLDPAIDPGTWVCNPGGISQPLFATRAFIGSSPTNDGNSVFEGTGFPDPFPGYVGGFNNTNTMGVTATSGTGAATATTGAELGIPLGRFGLTPGSSTIKLLVLVASGGGTGPNGTVHNQSLPPTTSVACVATMPIGEEPDLSTDTFVTHVVAAGGSFTGTLNGTDLQGTFGMGALKATQSCATSAGDQSPDPSQINYTGGSELNQLFVDNDNDFLYLGITGNLEPGGNRLVAFVDSVEGGERFLSGQSTLGGGVAGMEGDALPLAVDGSEVLYDYAYEINWCVGCLGEGSRAVFLDTLDLQADSKSFAGYSTEGSGDGTLITGDNPNGAQVALDRTNVDGVPGCGDADPCFMETPEMIAAQAATATKGFEIAIPFADIGVTELPAKVNLWTFVVASNNEGPPSFGGFGSDQGLPSLRNLEVTQKHNATNGPTDFTGQNLPLIPQRFYDARAVSYDAMAVAETVSLVASNPPDGHVDTLDTGSGPTLTAGIGAAGTTMQGAVQYATISVTFSGTPSPALTLANIGIACTGGTCPTVTGVTGSNAGPYEISLSGAIPPLHCTTLSFTGPAFDAGTQVQYQSSPGNVNLLSAANTQDLLGLIQALNNGTAVGNPAQYNVNRLGPPNTQDLLRIVQLLNGVLTTQAFNGAALTPCP